MKRTYVKSTKYENSKVYRVNRMGNIELFNVMAAQYDTEERGQIAKRIAAAVRACVAHGPDKTAIDYGCGTGLVGLELLSDFQSILFVDASQNMVKQVKQKLKALPQPNAAVLCCDLMEEAPPELHADYIILAQTLLHIQDTGRLLSRLYGILNQGGHLLVIDFDKNDAVVSDKVHNGFLQEELILLARETGFVKAEAETFYHGKNMFMNQDASLFILDAEKERAF